MRYGLRHHHFGRADVHIARAYTEDCERAQSPRCRGLVIWVSADGRPLSHKRQMAEVTGHAKKALFWLAVLIAILALLFWVGRAHGRSF
jgi:hypothetical protein